MPTRDDRRMRFLECVEIEALHGVPMLCEGLYDTGEQRAPGNCAGLVNREAGVLSRAARLMFLTLLAIVGP